MSATIAGRGADQAGIDPLGRLVTIVDRLESLLAGENETLAVLETVEAFEFETVAASQTDQVIGATGAVGDFLAGIHVVPATTSPGVVQIKDGGGSAITVFTGGTVSDLKPFFIKLGFKSASGAWKVTTGLNVSCVVSFIGV